MALVLLVTPWASPVQVMCGMRYHMTPQCLVMFPSYFSLNSCLYCAMVVASPLSHSVFEGERKEGKEGGSGGGRDGGGGMRERERERERERVCVCVRERERERVCVCEREGERALPPSLLPPFSIHTPPHTYRSMRLPYMVLHSSIAHSLRWHRAV